MLQSKILVTGHKGYIGSRVFKKLIDLGFDVTGLDLKDGNDISFCLPDEDFDFVFHMAALPSVQQSVEKPSYTMRQNVLATSILLEWCKNRGVKRLIFSSSAAAKQISSPYGLHKRMTEMECKLFSELYDLDTVCLRYYNVYSEDQLFGGPYSTVINHWMNCVESSKPLIINGDGEQTRDFVHVQDIVDANIFCMQHLPKFEGRVLDVGTGVETSLNAIRLYVDTHLNVEWSQKESRIGDIKNSVADASELICLGWSPKVSIESGLHRCFVEKFR